MDLLARREHSVGELRTKLVTKLGAKGIEDDGAIDAELDKLCAEGLLSDARFAEAFVHAHRRRGQGPLRIAADLRTRGLAAELIEQCVDPRNETWHDAARAARCKRFGDDTPDGFDECARQARFLRQRGFTEEQIRGTFKGSDDL
jgi:regulatory protein